MLVLTFGILRLFQFSIYTKIHVGESSPATVYVVVTCSLIGRYQHYGETYTSVFHMERSRWKVPRTRWYLFIQPDSVTSQKTILSDFTAVGTSNLTGFS
jgi:hypothetical protein